MGSLPIPDAKGPCWRGWYRRGNEERPLSARGGMTATGPVELFAKDPALVGAESELVAAVRDALEFNRQPTKGRL